jgi:site-specific DNA recombinase
MNQPTRRCAIYTRKSTEEGLEQAFNSLHAQREACEAFIKSQAHEGWKEVATEYDDGGFSGGTMERPALTRLMADLKRHLIDVIVVYKVDRLTRSLADFAKIVEVLDGHGASFVSVTQQFNTTTSMGRLTLNVLLSFAQFEREVTGERIRDKIAASKRRGMWMGGNVPLGYDVCERKLVVNDSEAETVQYIFKRYLELKRVSALQAELKDRGIVSKVWVSPSGARRGGMPYSRGALYYLLRNYVYIGRIAHKGESYAGQHSRIVEQAVWDQVQAQLVANRSGNRAASVTGKGSPLCNLLFDDRGNLMSPSFTRKANGRRYRYYVSQAILQNDRRNVGSVGRVPAGAVEAAVADAIKRMIAPAASQDPWLATPAPVPIRDSIERVVVSKAGLEILLRGMATSRIVLPGVLTRRGRELTFHRFGMVPPEPTKKPAIALVKAVCRAHHWRELFERGEVRSYYELARLEGMNPGYVRRVMQLAFLSPKLVEAIVRAKQGFNRGVDELTSLKIPLDWNLQASVLRLGEHPAHATSD